MNNSAKDAQEQFLRKSLVRFFAPIKRRIQMRDKEKQRHYAYEALHILLLLALLLFITRLWPILLLVILGIFIAALRLLFLSSQKVEPAPPVLALPEPQEPQIHTEQDMQSIAYQMIQCRISQILEAKYPDVRWIWENPRAKEDIMAGNKVYVILNRAGGYRRGLVVIRNLHVFDVIFDAVPEETPPANDPPPSEPPKPTDPKPTEDGDEEEDIPEDFGLIAFQWVEAHVMDLNEKVNEAIGRKETSFLIPAEDLPVKESWPDICKELARNDLSGATCHENGIQIEFEQ